MDLLSRAFEFFRVLYFFLDNQDKHWHVKEIARSIEKSLRKLALPEALFILRDKKSLS
jgi:hypothetical protein